MTMDCLVEVIRAEIQRSSAVDQTPEASPLSTTGPQVPPFPSPPSPSLPPVPTVTGSQGDTSNLSMNYTLVGSEFFTACDRFWVEIMCCY